MYRISKEFHFSVSHRLDHLPADHQCARLHGHNYVVTVELAAPARHFYDWCAACWPETVAMRVSETPILLWGNRCGV